MLQRLKCPTPFHEVRTIFMGFIASPCMDVSPMAPLAQLWGGELPEFSSQTELAELVHVVVNGLWNRLADHQTSRNPFRLLRSEVNLTRASLLELADMRALELAGFLDGLYGGDLDLHLPLKAHDAVTKLGEMHFMFAAVGGLLADESKPAPDSELKALLRNLQQMTILADELINKAVQSCKRARGQHLEAMAEQLMRYPLVEDEEAMSDRGAPTEDEP